MKDRSSIIFGNAIAPKDVRKADRSKANFVRKFGDDSALFYPATLQKNASLNKYFDLYDIKLAGGISAGSEAAKSQLKKEVAEQSDLTGFDHEKGIIVGNIRMGFGHYRISMAMASAAHALGYTPYWMDLNGYPETTCTKVISSQNDLYSLGSRLSQKSRLFNKFVWEPMNYEGFRRLSYNASDQRCAELMAPVFADIPKDIPLVATHVWPAQAALHGNMKYVVNAIPDNWPMALHLAEGALHTIQTHQAYQGYRILNGMQKKTVLNPMPAESLQYTGHYVDHEMVVNIETDCAARLLRKKSGKPMRFLLTIGGAGAQKEIFAEIIKELLPAIKAGKAALYLNVGDYRQVWEDLKREIPELGAAVRANRAGSGTAGTPDDDGSAAAPSGSLVTEHMGDWADTEAFAEEALTGDVTGIHAFWHGNIFEAVYCTNLLMRSCDVLVTKPSEFAFYPVPKLFIRRIGGHEMWSAIHSAEIGDGTLECRDIPHTLQMVRLFLEDDSFLEGMCEAIIRNKAMGIYDGAYKVIELAMGLR